MADLDIAAFLRDRFDEDEFVAGQTHWGRCGIWRDFHEVCDCYAKPRALADVKAKRQIIASCESVLNDSHTVNGYSDGISPVWLAERTLKLLALPYAGHPEFREEWK